MLPVIETQPNQQSLEILVIPFLLVGGVFDSYLIYLAILNSMSGLVFSLYESSLSVETLKVRPSS